MMEVIHSTCAGMDVHKESVVVCLVTREDGKRAQEVRRFGTMTGDLRLMADWLREHECPIVAMESTSVYWKPIFNLLEKDFEVILVNPAHIKNVPGRKTDVKDSEWLAQLLEHGLVRASFIPPREIRDLREVTRYRRKLIQARASQVQRLQKALEECNIKLSSIAADIRGVSGRAILKALLEGKKTPEEMAELTQGKMRKKKQEMCAALEGEIRPHQAWLIAQIIEHLDTLDENIEECDEKVEELSRPFEAEVKLLDTIPGINRKAAQEIIAEIGVNMAVFPSHRHFCSWAALCPGNNESAGKRKSGTTRQGNTWLRTMMVQCAHAAAHTKETYLASLYRHFIRKGANKAAVAVAHAMLTAIYFMLRDHVAYDELGADYLERQNKDRAIYHHMKRLKALGVDVFPQQQMPSEIPVPVEVQLNQGFMVL